MTSVFKAFLAFCLFGIGSAYAADPRMEDRVLGNPNAPVKVDEFVSLTCSHCAEFYNVTLPKLQAKYIDSGKVKFIMHDFPLDGIALKASAVARCMPVDEFYPFIEVLYKNQATWAFSANPDTALVQYASLGGLSPDKAKACMTDENLQVEIAAEREIGDKYKVEATPTFVLNDGADQIKGAQPAEVFSAAFDRLLAKKK